MQYDMHAIGYAVGYDHNELDDELDKYLPTIKAECCLRNNSALFRHPVA